MVVQGGAIIQVAVFERVSPFSWGLLKPLIAAAAAFTVESVAHALRMPVGARVALVLVLGLVVYLGVLFATGLPPEERRWVYAFRLTLLVRRRRDRSKEDLFDPWNNDCESTQIQRSIGAVLKYRSHRDTEGGQTQIQWSKTTVRNVAVQEVSALLAAVGDEHVFEFWEHGDVLFYLPVAQMLKHILDQEKVRARQFGCLGWRDGESDRAGPGDPAVCLTM